MRIGFLRSTCITVLLVALSTLYLDVFRNRLSKERTRQTRIEATATAQAIHAAGPEDREAILDDRLQGHRKRMRIFGGDGRLIADSWHVTGPTYELRDPNTQKWTKDFARALDRGFNVLVGAPTLDEFVEPKVDALPMWPEAARQNRAARPPPGCATPRTSLRSFPRPSVRRPSAARDRQRPFLHPNGAAPANGHRGRDDLCRRPVGAPFAVPCQDHRPPAAPAGACRSSGPAWPLARR